MRFRVQAVAAALALSVVAAPGVHAQDAGAVSGHVTLLGDLVPGAPGLRGGPEGASELRARVGIEARRRLSDALTVRAALTAEGLLAERLGDPTHAATLQPHDLTLTWSTSHAEVLAGVSQVVWGRLDEFQPTDVVNPIDVTRFFIDGRTAARRAVGLVRTRLFLPRETTLDAVYVPVFRRGTFDVLDESSSPFALTPREFCAGAGCVPVRVRDDTPAIRFTNGQGGARLSGTAWRVDWALMAWRGFETLPIYASAGPDLARPDAVTVAAGHPRTTVVGGDVETVRGPLGIRAEVAWHVEDSLQATDRVAAVSGRSIDAGLGVDRRAGDYRLSATLLMTTRSRTSREVGSPGAIDRRDLQVVVAADRSFARETRRVRLFAVHDPSERSGFVRAIGSWSVRDGWWLEASAGAFSGGGADTLSRLSRRDFASLGLTVHF